MTPEELEAIKARVPLRLSDSADVDTLLCELKSKDQIIADFTKALDGAHAIQNDLRGELEKAEAARELVSEMLKTAIKDREAMLLQMGDARALISKCREAVDDDLENRRIRHSAGRLHAELSAWLAGKRVELCKHDGARLKTSTEGVEACKKCGSILVPSAENRNDEVEWVETRCTSLACRGRRKGGEGFAVKVPKGQESGALCNECFSR